MKQITRKTRYVNNGRLTFQSEADATPEREVIHLCLRNLKATDKFREAGITPDVMTGHRKILFEGICDYHRDGCRMQPDAFRDWFLARYPDRKRDLSQIMDEMAHCQVGVFVPDDNLPAVRDQYRRSRMLCKLADELTAMEASQYDPEHVVAAFTRYVELKDRLYGSSGDSIQIVPASELKADEHIPWVWYGYLAIGHITLLSGYPKAGKSTLLAYLLHGMTKGSGLGTFTPGNKILVVSEETPALWRDRRDALGFTDDVQFMLQPFLSRPNEKEWQGLCSRIAKEVQDKGYKLVVFDTLASVSPVKDENDAAQMQAACLPLRRITAAGAAVMLIHHLRKSEGSEGTAARGSGALPGFGDIILEFRRYDADADDNRRRLKAYSRFPETPKEVVYELTEDGYKPIGTVGQTLASDRQDMIAGILPDKQPGYSAQDILDKWGEGAEFVMKPSRVTLEKDLQAMIALGRVATIGKKQSKTNPLRYYLVSR